MTYICFVFVCGFDQLTEPPYDEHGYSSFEICSCCGFEFGFDDGSQGISFDEYRKSWLDKGAVWFYPKCKPLNWDLKKQLLNINYQL